MVREHTIDSGRIHHAWDRDLAPALVVEPGDTVHFDLLMAGDGQVSEGATIEQAAFDFETIYNLSGPVAVEGAEPGDTLEIEILSLRPGEWGWTVFLPELGLLAEDFPDGYLTTWDLRVESGPARARRGGAVRAVSRDDGELRRGAGQPPPLPAAPRRRQPGQQASRRGLDPLAAGALRWRPVLVRRSACGSGGRRGLRERDRMRDAGDPALPPAQAEHPGAGH